VSEEEKRRRLKAAILKAKAKRAMEKAKAKQGQPDVWALMFGDSPGLDWDSKGVDW